MMEFCARRAADEANLLVRTDEGPLADPSALDARRHCCLGLRASQRRLRMGCAHAGGTGVGGDERAKRSGIIFPTRACALHAESPTESIKLHF